MRNSKKKSLLTILLIFASFLLVTLGSINLFSVGARPKKVLAASTQGGGEINFWEGFIRKNPTYVDALVRLSHLEIQRGNNEGAKNYLFMALKLSPNARSVIEAKKILGL